MHSLFNFRKSSNKANLPTLPIILANVSSSKLLPPSAAPDANNLGTNETTDKNTNASPHLHVSRRKTAKRKYYEKFKKFFKITSSKKAVSNYQPISENVGATTTTTADQEQEIATITATTTTDQNQETTAPEIVSSDKNQQSKSILRNSSRYDQQATPVSREREAQNMQTALENLSIEELMTSYEDNLCRLENYEMCIDNRIREQKEPPDWRSLRFPVKQNGPEHTPKTVIEWQLVHLRVQYLMSHIEKQAFVDETRAPYMKEASAGAWNRLNKQLDKAKQRKVQLAKFLTAETEKLERLQPGLITEFDPQHYFNNMEKPAKLFSPFLANITSTFTLPFSEKQEELRMHPDERNDPKLLSDLVFADEKYRLMLAELNYFKFLLQKKCSTYSHEHLSGLKRFSDLVSWGFVSA
ncbi:hypothetical protein ACO0QE_003676 [Hanseniaspora vineae]